MVETEKEKVLTEEIHNSTRLKTPTQLSVAVFSQTNK